MTSEGTPPPRGGHLKASDDYLSPPVPTSDPDRDTIVKLYEGIPGGPRQVGVRHENTRTFYLSVISALFVFLALAGTAAIFAGAVRPIQMMVGAVGLLISLAWCAHMYSFSKIFAAKRHVLRAIEAYLPFGPFTTEGTVLSKKVHVTWVDMFTAVVCFVLFVALMVIKFNVAPVP